MRKHRKSSATRKKTAPGDSKAPGSLPHSGTPDRPAATSRRRRWAFRVITAIVSPIFLFVLLEIALRSLGFGYPTGYYLAIGDGRVCGNPRFGWRFFPPPVARMPDPFTIEASKPEGTYRIIVLGSSAALGFPDSSFSFSRILEYMLNARFPQTKFEVVNTAMVAINSHVLLPIARDSARLRPDVMIVYEGNNEVIGPFGPGTVFSRFSASRAMVRTELAIETLRAGQAVSGMVNRLRGAEAPITEWKGMEFFLGNKVPADDPRLATVYENFAANLRDICDASNKAGARTLLCTCAVNLSDCPPFASVHRAGLSDKQMQDWRRAFDEGVSLQKTGKYDEALAAYARTSTLDGGFAELHDRLARCKFATGALAEARGEFERARDLDTLRFRTDSRLNQVVRSVASERHATLVDVEAELASASGATGRIPGDDWFLEHVHLNFDGNHAIACMLFRDIAANLPTAVRARNGAESNVEFAPSSRDACATALAYTEWDERNCLSEVASLMARPPFTNQPDHEQRMRRIQALVESHAAATTPQGLRSTITAYDAAIRDRPQDTRLHQKLGQLLLDAGEGPRSLAERDRVLAEWPFAADVRLERAGLLVRMGRIEDGEAEYRDAEARPACDRKCQAQVRHGLAVIAEREGRTADAEAGYREALRLDPLRVDAHGNLALLLANRGAWQEAEQHDRKVIELNPGDYRGHLNLGLLLARHDRSGEATAEFDEVARLHPDTPLPYLAIVDSLTRLNQLTEAVTFAESAAQVAPESAETHFALGAALLRMRRIDEAIAPLERAASIKPDWAQAGKTLELARRLKSAANR